jgi:hypothetical protein
MTVGALVSADSLFDDRLTRLEPRIRAKYFALADQVQALRDAARAAVAVWETEHAKLVTARGVHAEATALEQRDPEVVAARRAGSYRPGKRLEAAAAQLRLCEERAAGKITERDRIAQAAADAGRVLDAITGLITDTDPADLAPIVVPRPDGTNPVADVERIRETLRGVLREVSVLTRAPVELIAAVERLDRRLDEIAAEYTPVVLAFTVPEYRPPSVDDLTPYKILPLLAGLPSVRALLHDRLTAAYQQLPAALSHAERASLAAALVERKAKLETAEEALILLAETQGIALARRADASADVVLRVILKD